MQNKHRQDMNKLALFQMLDSNKDGKLDRSEISLALSKLGVPISPGLLDSIMNSIDTNKDGIISAQEFKAFIMDQDVKLKEVFNRIDKNRSGNISMQELNFAMQEFGIIDQTTLETLFFRMDRNRNGQISFDEFSNFMYLIPAQRIRNAFDFSGKQGLDIGESVIIPDEKKPGTSPLVTFVSGAIAGIFSRTLTAPLDRLKVLMQAAPAGQSTSILQGFKNIYKEGGPKGFFRGNGTNVIKIAPETAVKFIAFDKIKEVICKDSKKPQTIERLISGAVAGFTSQTLIYPLEITKTRLALAAPGTYAGIGDCLKTIASKEGPIALYKGWLPSVLGIIPYASIDLAVFSSIKEYYINTYAEEPSVMTLLCCGAFSGICGQLVSYPLALVRTKLQVQGLPGREKEFSGLGDVFTKTLQNEGPKGFYRGILPNFMKSVPAIAISYAVFEQTKQMFLKI